MRWLAEMSPGRRALVLGAVAVVIMVVGGALVASGDGSGGGAPRPSTAPVTHTADDAEPGAGTDLEGPGPSGVAGGIGVGFSRDEAGATAAAVSYAGAPQTWLYQSDEAIADSVAAVTIPGARAEITADVTQQVGLLRDELTAADGVVWYVVAPLATRVEDYADDRAVVRVWVVRVLSAEGVAVPQSGWQTLTLNLRWHGGDWKIEGSTETDGPTPQLEAGLQAWSASYLAEHLEGFYRVGAAP